MLASDCERLVKRPLKTVENTLKGVGNPVLQALMVPLEPIR
jgi:hypothetical protein